MSRITLATVVAFALAAAVWATAGLAHERTTAASKNDPTAACMAMMQGAGGSEEVRKAMSEFMQSDRGHQAMARMMEMARRMGNGDVMLGMTQMMDMMGSMGGGMMGGEGGMMAPGRQPGK